jgi:hypothetical protein
MNFHGGGGGDDPFEAGRRTLTPPDPQLKGAWYPGGFKPCTYQVKTRFQTVPFKMQLAPLTSRTSSATSSEAAWWGAVQVENPADP